MGGLTVKNVLLVAQALKSFVMTLEVILKVLSFIASQ